MDRDRFAEALMSFGDTVNQAYGGKQNIYGTYQEQKTKRMEQEAASLLAQQTAAATAAYRQKQIDIANRRVAVAEDRNKILSRKAKTEESKTEFDRKVREQGQYVSRGYVPLQPGEQPTGKTMVGATGTQYRLDTTTSLADKINQLKESGIDIAPGTSIYDKQTGLRIPLNPKLTEPEASAVAGVAKFKPLIDEMKGLVEDGVFKGNTISRAYNQWLAEGGDSGARRILAEDESPLEKLMSARAEAYKIAFSEGGKQLTDTEKKIVGAGLNFVGKSDKQIVTDLGRAMSILEKKGLIAASGRTEAKSMLSTGVNLDEIF